MVLTLMIEEKDELCDAEQGGGGGGLGSRQDSPCTADRQCRNRFSKGMNQNH
jgi:hypothetical protein